MCRWSTAVTFQHGDPLKKLASLEVQDTKRVGNGYPATAPASVWQRCGVEATGCQMVPYVFIWQVQYDGDNRSGRQSSLMTEVNTAHIKKLIHTDRCAPVSHMAPDFELCYSTAQYITVGVLQYCKVCTRWVSCALTDKKNMAKTMACLFPTTLHS